MNKEEAKNQILSILKGFDHLGQYGVLQVVDKIEPDHPKVKLPREVGEELDAWKRKWGIDVGEYLTSICTSDNDTPKAQEWREAGYGRARSNQLVDAYRYGWEAEPEELFYVLGPESWENRNAVHDRQFNGEIDTGIHFSDEEPSPLETPDEEYAFTRAELKKYHLDSDIFTLVPVEEEK